MKTDYNSNKYYIPTYNECVEICSQEDAAFYEMKFVIDGFNISLFNYRLAQYADFIEPIPGKIHINAKELRGLCFVFNTDETIFNHYIILDKFFNLNQVQESLHDVVKDFKVKHVSNKEDGSIASFIKLPNGKVIGKSKMGFTNDQSNAINRIYKTNKDVKKFVDFTLDNDITAIFEYVAPSNKIVLRYSKEELILLKLRDNKTGKHLDIKDYLDKIENIKVTDSYNYTLDEIIELAKTTVDKEGWVIQFENGLMIKIKTEWYFSLHNLLTTDIYRENIIINDILNDTIDDIICQIPPEEVETHERINKIIHVVRKSVTDKMTDINKLYMVYCVMGKDNKLFALKYIKNPDFGYVMAYVKGIKLKELSEAEITEYYGVRSIYDSLIKELELEGLAKYHIREKTKKLGIARDFLMLHDSSLFFNEPEIDDDN